MHSSLCHQRPLQFVQGSEKTYSTWYSHQSNNEAQPYVMCSVMFRLVGSCKQVYGN